MKKFSCVELISVVLFLILISTSAYSIGIRLEASSGGILEDAILITSQNGDPVRDAVILGDIDLSLLEAVYDIGVDPATTHWWLIGHEAGDVVFSSNVNLDGVDLWDIDPYAGDELTYGPHGIAANLDAYVSGLGASFDWWAQTLNNHHSHVTADGGSADLWLFSSPGHSIGSIAINIHTNEIPDSSPVPEPSTFILLGIGILGLCLRKKLKR